jgi:hypothetical protein
MFSYEHLSKLKELAEKRGDNLTLGKVMVNGNFKQYTYLTNNPDAYCQQYGDAKIIKYGDIRKIRYIES